MKVCGSMLGVTRQPCFVLKRVHPLGIQEFEHGSLPSHSTDTSWMGNSFLTYKQWNLQYFLLYVYYATEVCGLCYDKPLVSGS
jgi:hypothetical protein